METLEHLYAFNYEYQYKKFKNLLTRQGTKVFTSLNARERNYSRLFTLDWIQRCVCLIL